MATVVKPTNFSVEKWMRIDGVGGGIRTLFTFSGTARFGPSPPVEPVGTESLIGVGENDTEEQTHYVNYLITQMRVGPHWLRVDQVCPSVWAAGHDQRGPDEADGMGYEIPGIKKAKLVKTIGKKFSRLELEVSCRVAGGFDTAEGLFEKQAWGRIPALAYRVTALGVLANEALGGIGDEGVFFGDPAF